jgi:hypothetical protein
MKTRARIQKYSETGKTSIIGFKTEFGTRYGICTDCMVRHQFQGKGEVIDYLDRLYARGGTIIESGVNAEGRDFSEEGEEYAVSLHSGTPYLVLRDVTDANGENKYAVFYDIWYPCGIRCYYCNAFIIEAWSDFQDVVFPDGHKEYCTILKELDGSYYMLGEKSEHIAVIPQSDSDEYVVQGENNENESKNTEIQ